MQESMPLGPVSPASIDQAADSVRNALVVADSAGLEAASKRWASVRLLGLDTEFVRERTFRANPGLIQISEGSGVWLLDAVRLDVMPQLASVLDDKLVIKVLHSVGEDLEVLHTVTGSWPEPLFDTQIAAAMTGLPLQCRYEHLVETVFGAHLPGGKARNNWCQRPLAADLLEYAAQDVIWLPRLCEHLWNKLDAAGRLDWLQEDCARIVDKARQGDLTPPLSRIKGAGRLDDATLACLDLVAHWREDQAQSRNLPRRFVISDEALIEFAATAAKEGHEAAANTLPERLRQRHGGTLIKLMEQHDPARFMRPDWLQPMTGEQRQQIQTAQKVVRELAEELGLDPALIASKRELARIVRGERPNWLDGWRGELLAPRLQKASVSIPA